MKRSPPRERKNLGARTSAEGVDPGRGSSLKEHGDISENVAHCTAIVHTQKDHIEIKAPQSDGFEFDLGILETTPVLGIQAHGDRGDNSCLEDTGAMMTDLGDDLYLDMDLVPPFVPTEAELHRVTTQAPDLLLSQNQDTTCATTTELFGHNFKTTSDPSNCTKGKQTSIEHTGVTQNAVRQRRYRERKRQWEKRIKTEIHDLKKAIGSTKKINKELRNKQVAIMSMLEYSQEAYSMLRDKSDCGKVEPLVETTAMPDIHMFLEHNHANFGISNTYGATSAQQAVAQIDGSLPDTMMDMLCNVLKTVPPTSIYNLFHSQVSSLIDAYESCNGDAAKQDAMEMGMKDLFSMRTELLSDMAKDQPGGILSHLTDAQVDAILRQCILQDESAKINQTAMLELMKTVQLSNSQIVSLSEHWESFCDCWNKLADALHDSLLPSSNLEVMHHTEKHISVGSVDSIVDVQETCGLHGAMRQAFPMHSVRQSLENVSKSEVKLVLELAQKIYAVFTPVQKARLCVSQRAAPWCVHVVLMLAILSLDTTTLQARENYCAP